jgi:hypothetical protein
MRIERHHGTLQLSPIFDWFAADFGDVPRFVARFARPEDATWLREQGKSVRIRYFDYDWSLNDASITSGSSTTSRRSPMTHLPPLSRAELPELAVTAPSAAASPLRRSRRPSSSRRARSSTTPSALRFARDASLAPACVDASHFEALAKHFDERQIVEIAAVVALFGFLNRWNDALATTLEDARLAFAQRRLAARGWAADKHGA